MRSQTLLHGVISAEKFIVKRDISSIVMLSFKGRREPRPSIADTDLSGIPRAGKLFFGFSIDGKSIRTRLEIK